MSKQQFIRLATTTGEYLEIGTRLRQDGTPLFGLPMRPMEGVITKMAECDSGIFLHIKNDAGAIEMAHVQSFLPGGVAMNNQGIRITILNRAPFQMEIEA